jgi:DmsE family decaheme c-type cytochrome
MVVLGAYLSAPVRPVDEIDWVKLNPAFEGATFVNDATVCDACHDDAVEKYSGTAHALVAEFGSVRAPMDGSCESCHGPRSKHVEDPDLSLSLEPDQYSLVCGQCHEGGDRMYWQSGSHRASDVSCISCHNVMEQIGDEALLSMGTEMALCASCHSDVRAAMMKPSHHPVREGRMQCSSCHNPHGSSGEAMLVGGTVTETCFGCHQDKRGPFLWEHPPVREDCQTCHTPHGSINRSLLVTQNAALCTSCHQYGGHVNEYRYNRVSTPVGNGCVNCHTAVHGSNHPAGAKFDR